ncbi:MAG TPA: sugar-binding domain-containing protein [Syntrophomonadaceae bacterium]|nr:sugar-binding domain-containing protein [Syntrophomonadaceae bacterium]
MDRLFTILERFVPEALELMETRYQILRQVLHKEPVGRRQLAKDLDYTERLIRGEIDILKGKGAIAVTPAGINITNYGEDLLKDIDNMIPFLFSNQVLAQKLKQLYSLDEVFIVPGDSSVDYVAKRDLGRVAARYVDKAIYPGAIIAVTGGTTLAEMANAITLEGEFDDVLIVPARGGLGEQMEQQAGTIAAKIARAIGAQYRLLHLPDNLEEDTVEVLRKDLHVKAFINSIKSCNILIHGIGNAIEMAYRRGLSDDEIKHLQNMGAVGETLRYYFDNLGNIVYEVPGIGLELPDLENVDCVIAVAGGSNKADAIHSVLCNNLQNVLVTDEGAAKKILDRRGAFYGS